MHEIKPRAQDRLDFHFRLGPDEVVDGTGMAAPVDGEGD